MDIFKLSELGEDRAFADIMLARVGKNLDMFKVNLTPEQEIKYGTGPWYDRTGVEAILDEYEDKAEQHEFEAFVSLRFTLFNVSTNINN